MPGWEAVQKGGVVVCWRQRRSIDMEGALGGLVGISVYLGGFAAAKERIRHTVDESDDKRHTRGLSLPEETDTRLCLSRGRPRTFDLLKWAWQDEDRSIKPALSGESSLHTRDTPIG